MFYLIRLIGVSLMLLTVKALPAQSQTAQQWYDAAQERIDTLRKGDFEIQVMNAGNQPLVGEVKVRMKKHEFPFGISFDLYEDEEATEVPTETQWRQAAMYRYFNYGVSGNSFKWSGIDPYGHGPDHTNFEYALEWAQKVGWELRAHTLLWGGSEGDNHAMPQWVTNLGSAEQVYAACKERVQREVTRYKGVVKEYDVMNEPLHATYTQELYGDSLNWKCFEWAREIDPDAEWYVNEYNVAFSWGKLDEYHALIGAMIDRGTPVTGIGIQAHFWECCRPSIPDVVHALDKLSEFGLPIKLTEFDFSGDLSEAEQAADLIKVYTMAFSHPSVNGIIYWNLADHFSWRENAGLFTEDRRPKLAADTLLYLTQKLWTTNLEAELDAQGSMAFDAYFGEYVIEVQFGDEWKQLDLSLLQENDGSTFVLKEEDFMPKKLELLHAEVDPLNQLNLTFDQSVDPTSLNTYDFRVFAPNDATVTSMEVASSEGNVLHLYLNKEVSVLDEVSVSYFPGSLTTEEGAPAEAFGLTEVSIYSGLNQAPVVSDYVFHLSPNAVGGTQVGMIEASDPEGQPISFRIVAGDHLGVFGINGQGVLTLLNPFSLDFEQNGVYELTIKVSDGVHGVDIRVTISPQNVLSESSQLVHVYPNPSKGLLNIHSTEYINQLKIFDLSGQLVYSQHPGLARQNLTLDPVLPVGVYLLYVMGNGGVQSSRKIIIQ